jgi:hypothetical protein
MTGGDHTHQCPIIRHYLHPRRAPSYAGQVQFCRYPHYCCSPERSGSRTFLECIQEEGDSELAVSGSAPSPFITVSFIVAPRPCPSSDWMPLRHIAASSTLPPSRRGRRLSPLTRTLGRITGGSPRSHARNGSSASERPLTRAQV